MDFDTARPIISGLVGASIAAWLGVKWARRLPHAYDKAKQKEVAKQQTKVVRFANIGACLGAATGLVLYLGGFLDSRDWRGIGLMMGLTALLPILAIVIGNFRGGLSEMRAGFSAYAIAQKTPEALLFPLMGLMLIGGVWASIAFVETNNAEQDFAPNRSTAPLLNSESSVHGSESQNVR